MTAPSTADTLWLGSYTEDSGATGAGITLARSGAAGDLRADAATAADSPSFLALHPDGEVLYAALEFRGAVQAYRLGADARPIPVGAPVVVGEIVCHVLVLPSARGLIASCYGDGRAVLLPLNADGTLTGQALAGEASTDPYAGRADEDWAGLAESIAAERPDPAAAEEAEIRAAIAAELGGGDGLPPAPGGGLFPAGFVGDGFRVASDGSLQILADDDDGGPSVPGRQSRAHSALALPGGRIMTADLGHDSARLWRASAAGLRPAGRAVLPHGTGPRHAAWHPSGHVFVVTEYSTEVFVLRPEETGMRVVAAVPASADGREDGDAGAEITVGGNGEWVHVGLRGSDRIATLRVEGDGSRLRPIADTEAGGRTPRHHQERGDLLRVALQDGGGVATWRLDGRGIPDRIVDTLDVAAPSCIVQSR